jgi:hypothetical protein
MDGRIYIGRAGRKYEWRNIAMMQVQDNLPWWRHDQPWGFRFSAFDACVILAGILAGAFAWRYFGSIAVLVPLTLGHFLLFCNLFRVGGERSLIWIAALFINVLARIYFGEFSWLSIILTQLPVTALLIIHTVLGRNYHGVGCEWINPDRFREGAHVEGQFTRQVLRRARVPENVIRILTGK